MVMGPHKDSPHPPTVLVVDDDAEILAALRRLFRDEPYEVLTTQDPYEAWNWMKSRPVDLVIVDEFMPAMLGTELLEAARRESPDCARVVLTGHPTPTVAGRVFRQDVDLMLLKPWEDDALRNSVRRIMADRGIPRAAPPDASGGGRRSI